MINRDSHAIAKADFLLSSIARLVYESLLSVYHHHPHWFQDKPRSYPWPSEEFQRKFTQQLSDKLGIVASPKETIQKLLYLLNHFLKKEFFISLDLLDLISQIQGILLYHQVNYTSMILLDAENLSLEQKLEKILEETAQYPIQLKYAFANWRGLGKQDLDLHQRGYHLIHVPPDKNNADFKMTSLGLSIALRDSQIKEVFVCSSDRDLHHLSHSLLSHGVKCYRVSRQGNDLIVRDVKSSLDRIYSLSTPEPMLSLEEGIQSLKAIVQQECQQNQYSWLKLSQLSTCFQQKHQITLDRFVAHHRNGQKAIDLFLAYKKDFGIHQVDQRSEVYISIFQEDSSEIDPKLDSKISQQDIENFILENIKNNNRDNSVLLSYLAAQFYRHYSISLKQATAELGFGNHLPKALAQFESLEIQKNGNSYLVSYRKQGGEFSDSIETKEQFLRTVDRLTLELLQQSQQTSIDISKVSIAFHRKYKIPITQIMTQFGFGKKLTNLFKDLHRFTVTQIGPNQFVNLSLPSNHQPPTNLENIALPNRDR
jgi:NYN domain